MEENDPSLHRSFMDLEQDHWSFSDWRSPGRSADDEDTERHSSDEEAEIMRMEMDNKWMTL